MSGAGASESDEFQRLRTFLSRDLGIAESDIQRSDALGFARWWDSMSHLGVLLVLERWYGIKIDADAIADLFSIDRVLEAIAEQSHGTTKQ